MKLGLIGGRNCRSKLEWFWWFNEKFYEFLLQKGFDAEFLTHSSTKNRSGWWQYELFGHKTSFNPNNLLLVNQKSEKVVVFSTFYDLSMLTGGYCDLPREQLLALYSGHYDDFIVNRDVREDIRHKVKPWYFRPWNWEDQYPMNCYNPKNDSIYFRGLYITTVRDLIVRLQSREEEGVDIRAGKEKNWKEKMCEARLCFSMSGIRDMCNRDIEYWRAGVPFIRPRFTSKLLVDIPDDTYIPVEWDQNYTKTRTPVPRDLEKLTDDVIEKYKEVKDNKKMLSKIANNGHNFYKEYFTLEKIMENSFSLLEKSGFLEQ